jgi:drug/metabolite transporter (DMT)-like permease
MKRSQHLTAILQAIFVTILWSSSWILIKLGLRANMPALTFAGLRYVLAFICLVPFVLLNHNHRNVISKLKKRDWFSLGALGVVFYTLTQGAQFLSLAYLPAALVSLLLNLTPLMVGLAGSIFLREQPAPYQWFGIILTLLGVGLYLLPFELHGVAVFGVVVAIGGVLSNAAGALLGRAVNRQIHLPPLIVTFVSMGIGSVVLLLIGVATQGFGEIDPPGWLLIAWLAIVNTAFAFTLWNLTLKTLTAVESSIINSLMMPQIALLAFWFLGEGLTVKEIAGLVLVGLGALMVQLTRPR